MFRRGRFVSVLLAAAALQACQPAVDRPNARHEIPSDPLLAIDVLLEPDAKMVEKAQAVNARLRENYPQGYALDASHAAHITLVQGYVRAKDLDAITAVVSSALAKEQPTEWQFKATGYEYSVWNGTAITLLKVERSAELMRLEDAAVKAVQPFIVQGGTAEAFVTDADAPEINKQTVDWVANFVANASEEKFNPHVTVGVASEDFVKKLKSEPFMPFTFTVNHVAIYQLGNFGTARKKLWTWNSVGH